MNKPLITIGMSCYNAEDTVESAIKSALAQDWPNLEIIIADDGSQDKTPSIIKETLKGHTNARAMIYDKNKGFAGSLNTLILEAKGQFLAIFDHDDISNPDRVRRQYERIANYEKELGAGLVVCHAARIQNFPDGSTHYEQTMGTNDGIAPHGLDVADRILTGRLSKDVVGSCANCSRMARVSTFQEIGGYDAKMRRAEDTDFNVRLARAGGHFVGIAEPLVTQTMTKSDAKTLDVDYKAELILFEKHQDYLEQTGWSYFCTEWLEAKYEHLNNKMFAMFKRIIALSFRHPLKMLRKLFWLIPAHGTRTAFKKWHNEN